MMLQAVKIPEFSEVTWSGNRRLRKEAYWTQNILSNSTLRSLELRRPHINLDSIWCYKIVFELVDMTCVDFYQFVPYPLHVGVHCTVLHKTGPP